MAWCARAELALAQNKPALALDIVDQLIESAANSSRNAVIPRLSHLQGNALQLLGRPAEAEAALQAAHAAAVIWGAASLQWRIAIDLGRLYTAQRRNGEAEQVFATAQDLLGKLAATLPEDTLRERFHDQASVLLPQTRKQQPETASKNASPLTERELEVVRLLAQGLTNHDIATSLVISERTVNSHLVRIFNKLGG
jgi:DNA-binding NarL/FixJ family response regulator